MLSWLDACFHPHQLIASNSTRSITAAALTERCRRLAAELVERKVRVLVLQLDNGIDWLMVDLACQWAAICLVPLPAFFSAEQRRHVFAQVAVDAIICDRPGLFAELLGERLVARVKTATGALDLLLLAAAENPGTLPEHTGKITFTSGSTGHPKGVCLSKQQIIQQARALAEVVERVKPRHLCLLPLSTLLENVAGLYTPLLAGGEVILPGLEEVGFAGSSALDPGRFVATLSRYRPTSMILTPQLLLVLVEAVDRGWTPPPTLRFVAVGGAKVSIDLLLRAQRLGLPVYEGYGLSECASVVSLNTPERHRHGSCGQPLPHVSIEIVAGEIVVSGNAMLGYVGEPQNWGRQGIASGDIGRISADGYLFIDGRKKNVLISSYGRNINPEWVESELLGNPLLVDCLVVGDDRPYCAALLSPRNPQASDAAIQQRVDQVNARLPDYARVQRWQRLPRPLYCDPGLLTANGRPRRPAIMTHYAPLIESLFATPVMPESL